MNWIKLTNAFTSWPVHVRAGNVIALHQDAQGTLVELEGGGRVTVKESVDDVKAALDKAGTPKKREMETR